MSYRRLFILALLGALPTISWAQFTTFIPPQPQTVKAANAAVVARERARTDSVMKIKLSDMKAWVDSAAGSVAVPNTGHRSCRNADARSHDDRDRYGDDVVRGPRFSGPR
jgi:hypothetical protein